MGSHRRAVAFFVRREARRLWPSWVVLGLLVGLAVGAAIGAAAGARRTAAAYQNLVTETAALDGAVLHPACEDPAAPACPTASEHAAEVRAWPGVAAAGAIAAVQTPVVGPDGVWEVQDDPCNTGTGDLSAIVPLDDHVGRDILRLRILEGRDLDPGRTDEAVVAPEIAAQNGVEIGDVLTLYLGPGVECYDPATWSERTDVTVVGIGLTGSEVPSANGYYIQGIHLSPRLGSLPSAQANGAVAVRLEPGVSFADLQASAPEDFELVLRRDRDLSGDEIDADLRTDANALWLVTAVGGLAAAILLGPVLARHHWATREVDDTLLAIGWARRERLLRSVLHGLAISAVACGAALAVLLASSSRTPIGDARRIEPDPGVEVDAAVLVVGWATSVALVVATLAVLALRSRRARRGPRRTPVARAAATAGLPPSAVLGLRVGLEPSPGQAPVRSSILATALGSAAIVGVLVYTGGAQHLRETPAWRGVPWDDVVFISDQPEPVRLAERMAGWSEVVASSHALIFIPTLLLGPDDEPADVMAFSTGPGSSSATVIHGRSPTGPDEILVNPLLADRLDVEVGDRIDGVFRLDPALGDTAPFAWEVVGTGVVPVPDGRFGRGAIVTRAGYDARLSTVPGAEGFVDPSATDFLFVDRAPGVTDQAVVDRFALEGVDYDPDPEDAADFLDNVVAVDPTSTEGAPDLLGALMAAMVVGAVGYGLSVTITRGGRDLAVACALGLTPRQLRRCARWAGAAFAVAVLVIAVPVGVVAGRLAWHRYAEGLGVVPDPVVPFSEVGVVVLAGLALALLVASLAGRLRARPPAGRELRAD